MLRQWSFWMELDNVLRCTVTILKLSLNALISKFWAFQSEDSGVRTNTDLNAGQNLRKIVKTGEHENVFKIKSMKEVRPSRKKKHRQRDVRLCHRRVEEAATRSSPLRAARAAARRMWLFVSVNMS